MPNGTSTTDVDEYKRAWYSIAKPIEDCLGVQLIGYDPEFIFSQGNPQRPGIKTVHLPSWFVHTLHEALVTEPTANQEK